MINPFDSKNCEYWPTIMFGCSCGLAIGGITLLLVYFCKIRPQSERIRQLSELFYWRKRKEENCNDGFKEVDLSFSDEAHETSTNYNQLKN